MKYVEYVQNLTFASQSLKVMLVNILCLVLFEFLIPRLCSGYLQKPERAHENRHADRGKPWNWCEIFVNVYLPPTLNTCTTLTAEVLILSSISSCSTKLGGVHAHVQWAASIWPGVAKAIWSKLYLTLLTTAKHPMEVIHHCFVFVLFVVLPIYTSTLVTLKICTVILLCIIARLLRMALLQPLCSLPTINTR